MDEKYEKYICEYPFGGARWGFEISARSEDEARERLRAMAWAEVKGKVYATIPARDKPRWLISLFTGYLNLMGRK